MVKTGITAQELVELYPRVHHMAEDHTWDSIKRLGLLSTAALLEKFEVAKAQRVQIEARHRPEFVFIEHPEHGRIGIRDQKPMRERSLVGCLPKGMGVDQWYRLLNQRVFFWATEKRLLTLLSARPYRNKIHTVLTVDTAELVKRYENKISLSPINSGSTIYAPQPRGPQTFLRINDYPFEYWRKKRSRKTAVAEITVDYGVPDISEFIVKVDRLRADEHIETLFERKQLGGRC